MLIRNSVAEIDEMDIAEWVCKTSRTQPNKGAWGIFESTVLTVRKVSGELNRLSQVVLLTPPIVTLVATPWYSYDPINIVKMLALSILAFLALVLLILSARQKELNLSMDYSIATLAFVFALFIPFLLSPSAKSQQFWGVFGRNNGFLSYFSLAIIGLAAAYVSRIVNLDRKLNFLLIAVTCFSSSYGLLQYFGRDPVDWSMGDVYGTFGNTNFMSGFLGMGLIPITYMCFYGSRFVSKIFFVVIGLLSGFVLFQTQSSQGILIYFVGGGLFVSLHSWTRIKLLGKFLFTCWLILITLGLFGIFNRGPLSAIIFQQTTAYRYDYWRAGIRTFIDNPMNGVGLDSYGDFYRSYRDLESIQRTGPERYANAAHNIYIDLAANGGLLLILTYVVLNLMVLRIAILSFRKGKLEGLSLVLFAVWVAFIVQSLVSIGQLGVSVWGWVIAGTLIGSLKANLEEVAVHNRPRKKDKFQSEITSPLTVLAMFLSASVGLILAWPPFMADAKFREALESGNNQVIASRSISLGATSWHGDVALDILVKKGDQELALNQSKYLIQANPRDLFAIRTRMVLRGVSKSERFELFKLAKLIDPLNPEIRLPRESSISGG